MKSRLLTVVASILMLLAWIVYRAASHSIGVPVRSSMATPPLVISMNHTNFPLRVFPGVTGALIILPDGSLWSWGLRDGNSVSPPQIPTQIGTNCDWVEAFAANHHCGGCRADGTAWEWGHVAGNNKLTIRPTQIGQDRDWIGMAGGDVHTVALKRDGTVWAWGDNSMQQLGNGPGPNQPSPVQIGTNRNWTAIGCGQGYHTIALQSDGSLWVWGTISGFENGKPGVTLPTPIRVCREADWLGIIAGPSTCALSKSGVWSPLESLPRPDAERTLVCRLICSNSAPKKVALAFCGRPEIYQIGSDGRLRAKTYPIGPWVNAGHSDWRPVGTRTDWASLWGVGTTLGTTADGTLWIWGSDSSQESVPDFSSRYRLLEARVLTWFGVPSGRVTTSGTWPYQREPRPLLRCVPSDPVSR